MDVGPEKEATRIIRGVEETTNAAVSFFRNGSTISVCADEVAPSIAMGVSPIRRGYDELKRRNAKVRWITEISEDNLSYCRDLMRYAEVRHLDGVRGNFGVSDKEYIATATTKKMQPVPEVIYSNAKSVVEQNQYVFDTLWSRAVAAQDRIWEIDGGTLRRETKTLKNPAEILEATIASAQRSKQLVICSSSDRLVSAYRFSLDTFREILNRYRQNKHLGIRWIIKIDDNEKDNRLREAIRTFSEFGMKIKHVKDLPPMTFSLSEKEIALTIDGIHGESADRSAIFTNEPVFLEHFANIFEGLWNSGIDAKERLEQIQRKINTFIDIIENPLEIQHRYLALVASAKEQILLFLPTTTAYRREEKMGIFRSLEEAASRGAEIRILLPTDKEIEEKIQQMIDLKRGFEIRRIKTGGQTEARSKIVIVDKTEYLMVELRDNTKETFIEAVGSAIVSNSRPTVLSYLTMFDSLWGQSALHEKLEAHDRMQKEFINIAAHELRTPAQSILGYAELLQTDPGDQASDMLKALTRNAYRLQALITDILDVARIEAGTLILEKETLNLIELINSAVSDAESQAKMDNKKIRISHIIKNTQQLGEKKELMVSADRDRILQVLSNLLSNALKFTKEGEILVTSDLKEKEAIIKIKDTGSGIDYEIFPKLFEKFATKSEKGTGLGLFVSKNIIQAHGGKIWAENNPDGVGATFAFSLPMSL
ncbi:MAG TPA: ATP-binding protein [Nitrososphaera sp.]|nr:ATP-binding protein [Nitrososphaera sp.]